jgi:hypothetical protein
MIAIGKLGRDTMSEKSAEKAADEVRDALMKVDNPPEYNQGVDDAVEAMKRRWQFVENNE